MFNENVKLVLIPRIATEDFPLWLSTPTASNCGGYIIPSVEGKIVYAYSPIDLAVAALEAKRCDLIVSDLALFFYKKSPMLSEFDIYLGILIDKVYVYNIPYWKTTMREINGLSAILHKNAPLTFRSIS